MSADLLDAPCADEAAWVALNEYADGELAPGEAPALFEHLAGCPACRADFEDLLDARRALRAAPLDLPPAVDAALFARLEQMRRAASVRDPRRPLRRRAPLARALGHRVSVGASLGAALVVIIATVAGFALAERAEPLPPPMLIQTVDTHGAVFLLDRALTVEAEREVREDTSGG